MLLIVLNITESGACYKLWMEFALSVVLYITGIAGRHCAKPRSGVQRGEERQQDHFMFFVLIFVLFCFVLFVFVCLFVLDAEVMGRYRALQSEVHVVIAYQDNGCYKLLIV